jgi:hypothetical protein
VTSHSASGLPRDARFVAGFGRIYNLPAEALTKGAEA